ncbi:MAG: hypothetical protein PHH40_00685 [Candidatus Moranbacteria bacterium]|nr:hypothetical protein [Candidatus Moranbacteria bacterium]MDD3964829.1 hypothetical protein [Candidatus Moranbacteria bacterium]
MKVMKKFVAFMATHKEQIALIATGQGVMSVINWLYDNPLYIGVIAYFGPVVGGAMMTAGSLVICLGLILFYNKKGVDWLGVGALDAVKEISLEYAKKLVEWRSDSIFGKIAYFVFYLPIQLIFILAHLVNHKVWGGVVAFVLLSIFTDPFVTTAYSRHGNYGPMKVRDWVVFFGSVVLSNGYWIFRTTVVIEVAKAIWKFV